MLEVSCSLPEVKQPVHKADHTLLSSANTIQGVESLPLYHYTHPRYAAFKL
jgi:hypothetical protein